MLNKLIAEKSDWETFLNLIIHWEIFIFVQIYLVIYTYTFFNQKKRMKTGKDWKGQVANPRCNNAGN